MRVNVEFNGTLINAKTNLAKNGNTYYQLSVDCDGDAGSLSCTEDVYKNYVDGVLKRFQDYHFLGSYNSQYGSLQIASVLPKK